MTTKNCNGRKITRCLECDNYNGGLDDNYNGVYCPPFCESLDVWEMIERGLNEEKFDEDFYNAEQNDTIPKDCPLQDWRD